jgi:D-cysteine desulfhydrase
VLGFAVAKTADELRADVSRLAAEVGADIGVEAVADDRVIIDDSVLGAGYGVATSEGEAAIRLLARTEGVLADPVYTGKGLAGLLGLIRAGRFSDADAVVFLHTGGTPALFAAD